MSLSMATLYMTAPSRETAETIGRALLEKRLVACVNILGRITSLYRWEGEIQEDEEVLLLAKTQMRVAHKAIQLVKEVHSYDVPCVTVLPVLKANPDYAAWVRGETTPQEPQLDQSAGEAYKQKEEG
ncbi:MAG: divalent-cation tolerance protein CutA, partial [Desulfovibrionales bacterium]